MGEMKKYCVEEEIDIFYKNDRKRAKIISIEKNNRNKYDIVLSVDEELISFSPKDLGVKVVELDELGIELWKETKDKKSER